MKITLLALIAFLFCPHLAHADTGVPVVSRVEPFPANCSVAIPDISDWAVVQKSRIEFRISNETVAYLGLDFEYRNPLNNREFIRVISRHLPLIPQRQKGINERSILDVSTLLYTQKAEQDRLNELDEKTDPILYMRWGTKENLRTGKDVQGGDVDVWFLQSSGECFFAQIDQNEQASEGAGIQFMTENVGNGKPWNVFIGMKYGVGDIYHILKVDRRDIIQLIGEDQ